MKLLITIVLISVLTLLIVQQFSAVDENAATRYLLAIANLDPEVVNAHQQFKDCKCPNDLDMLSGQAKKMLMAPRNEAMLSALKWGAKCKICCYNPDDKDSPDQIPKEKLRGLYRFSMALALNAEKNEKPDQALEILLAVFQLGQHQELQGSMLDGLIGMTIRSDALDLIEGVLNRNPGQARHNTVRTFLKQLPSPAVDLKAMVKWEKRFLINGLKKAASNPAIWKEMCFYRPDEVSSEAAKVLEVFDPENEAAAREFIASGEFNRCLNEVAGHMDSWITLDQQDPDFKKKSASLALLLKNNPLAICVPNINKVTDQQEKLQEHINSMLR
ncbi:MAG: hypothetical protein CVV41_17435 [Candidatus Riflebacteria bacterium HGW-Riflebacteria-1]|jgi:hypothetical protein|nr:MAG: hypothetical protein CVV41_17435 [Candidatus Riflebacteria bacterium HGW-Riflebacteria-1]